jgi:nucleoid DNA-binding protein
LKAIEEHIFELLHKHDCVTLPNFGGFVGQYTGAQFEESSNTFLPPSKQIRFNKHLTNDDGLLTHDVANHRAINYANASESIKNYIETLKKKLATAQRVEIPKLGVLYIDHDQSIKFVADGHNFSTHHFGLPAIKPTTIQKETIKVVELTPETTENKEAEATPIVPISKAPRKGNYWWAATILLPILFYSAWIPMKTDLLKDHNQFHYSDLNPFTFQKNKKYKVQEIQAVESNTTETKNFYTPTIQKVNLDDSTYLWVDNRPEVPAAKRETTYVEPPKVEETKNVKLVVSYHLIGGCFGKEENARNLVNQMKELGYQAQILDQNKGLFRVSIGQFSKRKTAKKQKEVLKSNFDISSWILKK